MPILASLVCGFLFGWGLTISGMIQPAKVLGFLDVFGIPSGAWDPSLAVVMAAGLAVTGIGYALARRRPPLFAKQSLWPASKNIDRPLISGALLFGIGWGLVGLCPGPAIANLAALSAPVIVFVVAMTIGMLAYDLWQSRSVALAEHGLAGGAVHAPSADG
jgi:uncharacterized membrane protein YedE/YeeE